MHFCAPEQIGSHLRDLETLDLSLVLSVKEICSGIMILAQCAISLAMLPASHAVAADELG